MNTLNKTKYILYITALTTVFVSSLWGLFFMAPGAIKAIYASCLWFCIIIFPYISIQKNDLSKTGNYLLITLLIMTVIQIVRSIISTEDYLYAFGNKWLTLFGNEYTSLLLFPPLFTYLGTQTYSVHLLKKSTYIFLVIGLILSVFMNFPLAMLTTFIIALYPYVGIKYKLLIVISIIEAFIKSTVGENSTRMYIITAGFALICYLLVYIIQNIKIIKFFAVTIIIAPLFLFVPILFSSDNNPTTFQNMQAYIMQKSEDESLASDTRTFLYLEMAEDLNDTKSWLWGKGAYSTYYSYYFDESSTGKYGRISSEVPFLNFLLRGGILYVTAYFGLILLAIYQAIWNGKNKFVQSIGIIALGWYFNSFIGDITGCRFYHIAFFLLLGCCLSRRWLNYTNNQITYLLKQ